MSVRIIVDSTTNTVPEIMNRLTVVPLPLFFGEEEYLDGVTIDHKMFYKKLIESDVLPTTSQANPATFAEVFEKVAKEGDSAVVITVASDLSGTYQSAMIAAADYTEHIYVVDGKSVAIGTGILAERALQLADDGMTAKEIAEQLEKEKDNVCLIAMLDTLEYLKKGGRISKTVAFAGGVLNIKPVVCIEDGKIIMLGKARGSKQGNNLLVQEIQKTGGVDFDKPIMLGYTGLSDDLLQKYISDSKTLWEEMTTRLRFTPIGCVVGTHAGPGAIAAAYFKYI